MVPTSSGTLHMLKDLLSSADAGSNLVHGCSNSQGHLGKQPSVWPHRSIKANFGDMIKRKEESSSIDAL